MSSRSPRVRAVAPWLRASCCVTVFLAYPTILVLSLTSGAAQFVVVGSATLVMMHVTALSFGIPCKPDFAALLKRGSVDLRE